jgi:hypothetical protein
MSSQPQVGMGRRCRWLALGVLALLQACAAPVDAPAPPDAYVVLGVDGQAIARVLTGASACPVLQADGAPLAMNPRAAPERVPARPGQAKPSDFTQRVCEAVLPAGLQALRLGGQRLPLPAPVARRIVVLGDTGCRIKAAEHAFQSCDDPQQWPFAGIAAAAAAEHPDLVVHVGDYHYRESRCPDDQPCAHSVWGYGADAWEADFFAPARPLLQAAPWVLARGNHEECARAGQGWFRLLDPRPFEARRSCDDPAQDAEANFSAPYAVPLGGGWQLIVFDSALASKAPDLGREADRLRQARYEEAWRGVDALAQRPGLHSLFVSHHPPLGFTAGKPGLQFGNAALLSAMQQVDGTRYFPVGVEAALHGHVHSFQAIDFASGHPASLVAGHGGDLLDPELAGPVAAAYDRVPGVRLQSLLRSHSFGYLVLERDAQGWTALARRPDGSTLSTCRLRSTRLACTGAETPGDGRER